MATKEPAMVGVSTRVPKGLWQRVRMHCVKHGVTVQAFLIGLLERGTKGKK